MQQPPALTPGAARMAVALALAAAVAVPLAAAVAAIMRSKSAIELWSWK
eukprot:CAMPEP_0197527924 /NCGR_PEP_ID=MMETSP1318-20131121/23249_1 /TAXON_ID=552666 /ORGANISM="Partenskyella glossopodia, Strain RCC365" /LENGTH=48 /DNA_ID= /DNA_START= /DNA_END= /DNA_ORIENTATION=